MSERIFDAGIPDEHEATLRPSQLSDYIGQLKIKQGLVIYIKAAKERKDTLDHILLYGPPGLGKTTLAGIIANELGANFRTTSGPAIESAADLAAVLTNLAAGDILFIDEIHRLNRQCEEILYSAMEDFALDMILGKGPSARTMRLKLEPFTLIGATTRAGKISSPLRDRFGIVNRLEMYSVEELEQIITRSDKILNANVKHADRAEIAKRSRGTPRIANRILKRARDFLQTGSGTVFDCFKLLGIDDFGLDQNDKVILKALIDKGAPIGIETLAAACNEDIDTIEDIVEPYLLQLGLIEKTTRGRVATEKARTLYNSPSRGEGVAARA